MRKQLLTFDGPGHRFVVPGNFELERGQSRKVDADLAAALVAANPRVRLTVSHLRRPAASAASPPAAPADGEPEAHEGEGHEPREKE